MRDLPEGAEPATELAQAHRLLSDVGIGHADWPLPARLALVSCWMQASPTNARLLAALQAARPFLQELAAQVARLVALDEEPPPGVAAEAARLAWLAEELAQLAAWQVPLPPAGLLVEVRVSGPAEVVSAPPGVVVRLVGPTGKGD